jgi:NAD(P)-dependent dehydrogenase (short-subunit alcohol dehydrogenase family)
MPRPKTGDKRAAILRAAIETIAEDGIGASTAKIAKAAGVAEGTLFRSFENKDTLLNELYLALKLDVRAAMTAGFPVASSLRRRIQHMWNAYISWGMDSPAKRKAMVHLNVSERITDHTRQEGQVGLEHATEAMHQLIAHGKLHGMPPTFASDLLLAMAETTMVSMTINAADLDRLTGSASGLGRDIAEAVLASGDRLLATARDPQRLSDLVERYGEQVHTASLDVADETAAQAAVAKAVDVFGRLDVLVNNAGYGDMAPCEQISSERFRALIDTNFFGVVSMTRAAIPIMRKQKSGYILQISSVGGRLATPGSASYHAAKWAVGGFTEAIAQEVVAFGVKVCALEPGGMRTNYGNRATKDMPTLLPEYEPSVGALVNMLERYWGHETSDPAKVAQVILRLDTEEQLPAHLLLGSDTVQYARFVEDNRESDAKAWRDVSLSTDAEGAQGQAALKL